MTAIEKQGYAARQAARQLAVTATADKDRALETIAQALLARQEEVLSANAADLEGAVAFVKKWLPDGQ